MTSIGSATSASYATQLQKWFKSADQDRDGAVNLKELETAGKNLPAGNFSQGVDAESLLKYIDTDRDGSLSPKETDAFVGSLSSEAQAYLLQVQASSQSSGAERLLAQIDLDGDGSVSQAEARTYGKQMQSAMLASMFGDAGNTSSGALDLSSLITGSQAYKKSAGGMTDVLASMLSASA